MNHNTSVLGLDIGKARVGVAKAIWPDGIASPFSVLANDPKLIDNLRVIVAQENVTIIVAGLPRSLKGEDTNQTRYSKKLADELGEKLKLKIYFQDEAVTSLKAEEELKSTGRAYSKSDIDVLSAVYILEDFLKDHQSKGTGLE